MLQFNELLIAIKQLIWSTPLLLLLVGTGLFFTIALKGVQFRYLATAFREALRSEKSQESAGGDISHFEALMTSLAGTIGTGNVVGVATAICMGGLGSLFWMWLTALLCMATKYAESLLAVKYRTVDERGEMIGGPMQYIERGLGPRWKWMACFFAASGALAALFTGNLVQVNAITETAAAIGNLPPLVTGLLTTILTALVIIGGVKSIGQVSGVVVPLMALLYLGGSVAVISIHWQEVPEALSLIFSSAFSGQAALGGFSGATVAMALQMGVARSVFTNEAGLGLSSIAAAAARTNSPAKQGLINMTGTLISTVVICTITGLVLAVTHIYTAVGPNGHAYSPALMAFYAFDENLPGGNWIVCIGLMLFAFTTIIAWAYYGEKCCEYLFGTKSVSFYRIIFCLVIIPGSIMKLDTVWHLADITNGLMAYPNLLALMALWRVIKSETDLFIKDYAKEMQTLPSLSTGDL
jgi:AGCS family alanine or glycine:cation symporter